MKSNRLLNTALLSTLIVSAVLAAGCGSSNPASSTSAAGTTPATVPAPVSTSVATIDYGSPSYLIDASTQCNDGTTITHCCPAGYAMFGYNHSQDLLACAQIPGRTIQQDGTLPACATNYQDMHRFGVHACPVGTVLAGLSTYYNVVTCCTDFGGLPQNDEFVDVGGSGESQVDADGYMSHACPTSSYTSDFALLTGIQVNVNTFLCM